MHTRVLKKKALSARRANGKGAKFEKFDAVAVDLPIEEQLKAILLMVLTQQDHNLGSTSLTDFEVAGS